MDGIGRYIRERRERLGKSQTALAAESGVDRAYLSQIEKGNVALPGVEMRRRLAAALDVSPVDLLIAAGELRPEELMEAGKAIPQREEAPGSAEIHRLVDQIEWTPRRVQGFADMLRFIASEPSPADVPRPVRNAGPESR